MLVRTIDYVGSSGGGLRVVGEVLKSLERAHSEITLELASYGTALKKYRTLLEAKRVKVKSIEARPKNYARHTTFGLLRVPLVRRCLGGVIDRWHQYYYAVPESALDGCDVVWFPWVHRHWLPASYTGHVVGTFQDAILLQSNPGFGSALADEWELTRRWLASPARLVATSRTTVSTMGELFGTSPERFTVIPLSGRCTRAASTTGALSSAWDWSERPFLIYPAATVSHKNHEVLLEGVAAWGARYPLVLTGKGTDLARSRRGIELRNLAESRGLEIGKNLIPLGYVSNATYDSLFSRAWALVMPTLAEGFGLPVLEAMERGIPVVCSDIPVLREQVERVGGDVLWINPHNPLDLARTLQELDENYEQYKTCAVHQVGELHHFSWRDVANEYWDLFTY